MSDTSRRYHAIKQGLMHVYRPRPTGHRDQHLTTLVAMICGLIGGNHAQLPTIADHAPSHGATQESVIQRFRRFLRHEAHIVDTWCLPVAQALLQALAHQPTHLIMDGRVVGRGCLALMVSAVYRGRALPLWWVVVSASKGAFLRRPTGRCRPKCSNSCRPRQASSSWGMVRLTASTSKPICAAPAGRMSAARPPPS